MGIGLVVRNWCGARIVDAARKEWTKTTLHIGFAHLQNTQQPSTIIVCGEKRKIMNNKERYTAAQVVPKESIVAYGAEFISHIADAIKHDLSEKVLDRAEHSDIIVTASQTRVTEQPFYNQVEYRRWITVADLVRCKDCIYHEDEQPGMVYCPAIVGGWVEDEWFCKGGERKNDE